MGTAQMWSDAASIVRWERAYFEGVSPELRDGHTHCSANVSPTATLTLIVQDGCTATRATQIFGGTTV
jgi:hypothetical protein